MIKPVLQDDTFLADVARARSEPDRLHLWWLGQSGFLVLHRDHCLLLDPYLSDSLTLKYAGSDRPHVRLTERVVAPERLDFIQVVTSSHNHSDHLDRDTLVPLWRVNPALTLVVPEANRAFASERLGVPAEKLLGVDAGGSVVCGAFTIHGIPSAHNELEQDDHGHHRYLGYLVQVGRWTLYHSGDTKRYAALDQWLRRWTIDLALLPINGDQPERGVAGNLDGREAAQLAHDVGARWVIPCHYDLFEFNTAPPDAFAAACRELGQPYHILRNGERWSSEE